MAYNLKDEAEVKEYIENLGIEYRFGCFNEKKADVCHLLGDYLEAIKKDYGKAYTVYKNNCDDRNYGKSCYKIGTYTMMGKGGKTKPGSFKDSIPYFEKGCSQKDPDACLNYGLLLVTPPVDTLKTDIPKGIEALKFSCINNNTNACYYLSGMYISGVLNDEAKKKVHSQPAVAKDPANFVLAKNMAEAFKYTEIACNLDHIYSCANLSRMYKMGEGVAKDEKLAEQFRKKAVELEDLIRKQHQPIEFGMGR